MTNLAPHPDLISVKQATARYGWSRTTLWRKVKQCCFPYYSMSANDIRFKISDIEHYIESTRRGGFAA